MNRWQDYYNKTKNRGPSELLVEAAKFAKNKGEALDLGAGALNDSRYLVSLGFRVTAVDKENLPKDILSRMESGQFQFVQASFDEYKYPLNHFNLINAQYALPFNGSKTFTKVWWNIYDSLVDGGIFTGVLFGSEDEWNIPGSDLIFFNKKEIEKLLSRYEVLELQEKKEKTPTVSGQIKDWHTFEIIGRKRG